MAHDRSHEYMNTLYEQALSLIQTRRRLSPVTLLSEEWTKFCTRLSDLCETGTKSRSLRRVLRALRRVLVLCEQAPDVLSHQNIIFLCFDEK